MDLLREKVVLSIPNFRSTVPDGFVKQYSAIPRNAASWYAQFCERIATTREYLPVYRMSDGEFIFACGRRPPPFSAFLRSPIGYVKHCYHAIRGLMGATFRSGSAGYGYESYTPAEWRAARASYAERVRRIASRGILAINLVEQSDGFAEEYIRPFCRWLDHSGIQIDQRNYYPFYFVYALLLGPDAARVVADRRVLVVTSDEDGTKAGGISRSLRALGAADVVFRRISRNKSMFDRIDTTDVGRIDLVLIGAGVGAVNILEQVECLNAVAVDAGFVLDCMWRPERFIGRRVFTLADGGAFGGAIAAKSLSQ